MGWGEIRAFLVQATPGVWGGVSTSDEWLEVPLVKAPPGCSDPTTAVGRATVGRHSSALRWTLSNDVVCSRRLFQVHASAGCGRSAAPEALSYYSAHICAHDRNNLVRIRRRQTEEPTSAPLGKGERVTLGVGDSVVIANKIRLVFVVLRLSCSLNELQHSVLWDIECVTSEKGCRDFAWPRVLTVRFSPGVGHWSRLSRGAKGRLLREALQRLQGKDLGKCIQPAPPLDTGFPLSQASLSLGEDALLSLNDAKLSCTGAIGGGVAEDTAEVFGAASQLHSSTGWVSVAVNDQTGRVTTSVDALRAAAADELPIAAHRYPLRGVDVSPHAVAPESVDCGGHSLPGALGGDLFTVVNAREGTHSCNRVCTRDVSHSPSRPRGGKSTANSCPSRTSGTMPDSRISTLSAGRLAPRSTYMETYDENLDHALVEIENRSSEIGGQLLLGGEDPLYIGGYGATTYGAPLTASHKSQSREIEAMGQGSESPRSRLGPQIVAGRRPMTRRALSGSPSSQDRSKSRRRVPLVPRQELKRRRLEIGEVLGRREPLGYTVLPVSSQAVANGSESQVVYFQH